MHQKQNLDSFIRISIPEMVQILGPGTEQVTVLYHNVKGWIPQEVESEMEFSLKGVY